MMEHAYNPSYSGGWGRIAWTQEVEVAMSRDRAIALQPGQKSKTLLPKKKDVFVLIITKSCFTNLYNWVGINVIIDNK